MHSLLDRRVTSASNKRDRLKTKKAEAEYIERAKEIFAFVHLLDDLKEMQQEIVKMNACIDALQEMDERNNPTNNDSKHVPEMFSSDKKRYLS